MLSKQSCRVCAAEFEYQATECPRCVEARGWFSGEQLSYIQDLIRTATRKEELSRLGAARAAKNSKPKGGKP